MRTLERRLDAYISIIKSAVQMFTLTLQTIFHTYAPLIEKRIKGRPCTWLNACVKKKMKNRYSISTKKSEEDHRTDWQAYKRLRNE